MEYDPSLHLLYWRDAHYNKSWFLNEFTVTSDLSEIPLSKKAHSTFKSGRFWWRELEKENEQLKKSGIQLTHFYDSHFPQSFNILESSPPVLTYKGERVWMSPKRVGIVGSRNPHPLSKQWLEETLPDLILEYELVTLSGGAIGIDQTVHWTSIKSKQPTICFLPCGLNHIYPKNLKDWISPILDAGGVLLSPFPANFSMRKYYFHFRNKLIVLLSQLVMVVEANRKSGSAMTANWAMKLGLPVATLPIHPLMGCGQYNNDLIFDGAYLVRDALDIQALLYKENIISQKPVSS